MSGENNASTKVEQEIDSALRMLAEVQAPRAMASRIHRSLEEAALQPVRSSVRAVWVPATFAAAAAILLAVLLQTRVTRTNQTFKAETAKMVATSSAPPVPLPYALVPVPEISRERKVSASKSSANRHGRQRPQNRHAANLFNYPLTRQEKLLVQFVQTAKPADLQALNPEYQAKIEAQQDAAFAAYVKSGDNSSAPSETNQQTQE